MRVTSSSLTPKVDTIMSILDSRYPRFLSDPKIIELVKEVLNSRINGVLMMADYGCGREPVSHDIATLLGRESKTVCMDAIAQDEIQIESDNFYYAQIDIREPKAVQEAKRAFFKRFRSVGKSKFDIAILSNVLNYMVRQGEKLDDGKVSEKLDDFLRENLLPHLSAQGIVVIQNGDKWQRSISLDENEVNDYFSEACDEVIKRYFSDIMYMGIALIEEKGFLSWRTKRDILSFKSHGEFQEIQKKRKVVTAVNIRCMIKK